MKIALIVSSFPNVSETFVVQRVTEMRRRGWDIHVVAGSRATDGWRWFPDLAGDVQLRACIHTRPNTSSRIRVALLFPVFFLKNLVRAPLRTVRYIAKGRRSYGRGVITRFVEDSPFVAIGPQLIHWEFGALAIGREVTAELLNCRSVASFQGYDVSYVGLEQDPGYYARLWGSIDAAHFVSADLHSRAKRRGLPEELRVHIVPNGIDDAWFDAAKRVHSDVVGTAERPVRLLSVGRLHWKKGYDHALQTVRALFGDGMHCEYRIVGEGDHRSAILFARTDLGLEQAVDLLGAQGSAEVRDQMAWADVFLHSATSEGFCIAVAEAQAMGLPVVASDADGLSENVEDQVTGFIVPRRDPHAAAARIATLARDPALRARMGQAGVARVRTCFSLGAHIDGIEQLYHAAMHGAVPPSG